MLTRPLTHRLTLLALVAALALGLAAPALAAGADSASVDVDALNLRAGAGLSYQVLRVLPQGQSLRVLGRSADSQWLEVRLPSGAGGWVFARYVKTTVEVARLPITEAAGGPTDSGAPASGNPGYQVYMTIEDGQATVQLQRFPKEAAVSLRLESLDGRASLAVAEGRTDAAGLAQIGFSMPRAWADGRALEADLRLVVSTADGAFTRSATIRFYR
ncbi:MAG: SH3 domain-containing protein [Anaerolineales bacterium]|nr:SH3 domain-containing protein [Anaerolineales bacterium]